MSSISSSNSSSSSKRPLDSSSSADHSNSAAQKYQKTNDESTLPGPARTDNIIQFFVRTHSINRGSIVFRLNADDRISSVREQIKSLTGIPLHQQRLIYQGKELQGEMTLNESKVQNDGVLQLVGRLRSSNVSIWQQVNGIIDYAKTLYESHHLQESLEGHSSAGILYLVRKFLQSGMWKIDNLPEYLDTFRSSSGPQALVMLSTCSNQSISYHGGVSIHLITRAIAKSDMPEYIRYRCILVAIEFCMCLRKVKEINSSLYRESRSSVRELVGSMPNASENNGLVFVHLIPIVVELAGEIVNNLRDGVVMTPSSHMEYSANVRDFCEFLIPVMKNLKRRVKLGGCFKVPFSREQCTLPGELVEGITSLHRDLLNLLIRLEKKAVKF